VTTEVNRHVEGKNVLEIAQLRDLDPADAALDLLLEENAGITMVVH
jgi:N-acyl-D-amino-acid deacylase